MLSHKNLSNGFLLKYNFMMKLYISEMIKDVDKKSDLKIAKF